MKQSKEDRQRARFIYILMLVWTLIVVWFMLLPSISKGGDHDAISWAVHTQEYGSIPTDGPDQILFRRLGYIYEPYTVAYDI